MRLVEHKRFLSLQLQRHCEMTRVFFPVMLLKMDPLEKFLHYENH